MAAGPSHDHCPHCFSGGIQTSHQASCWKSTGSRWHLVQRQMAYGQKPRPYKYYVHPTDLYWEPKGVAPEVEPRSLLDFASSH